MPQTPAKPSPDQEDWGGARGEKWLANLAGMEATLAPVNEPLLQALRLSGPCRITDIGCGGGGATFAIAGGAPAGSEIRGYDLSPVLIEAARRRARFGANAVTFDLANMATTDPPKELYDRLASRFGIMFFDDAAAAFANLLRWLVPGGRFAFAAWGPQARNPWLITARDVVAEIIPVPKPDPEAPGPFRYAESDTLLAVLAAAGFDGLAVHTWQGALPLGGGLPAAAAASFALTAFSSLGELLVEAGEEAQRTARQALTARLAPFEQEGAVRMDACVHLFTGMRPA